MAGLLAGQGAEELRPVRSLPRLLLTGVSLVGCAYFLAQTLAANYSAQGRTAQSTQDAQTFFALAQAWDGLNARPPHGHGGASIQRCRQSARF